jgi:hypothetical protein
MSDDAVASAARAVGDDYGDRFIGIMDDGYECDCRALYDPATQKVLAFGCSLHGPPYAWPGDPSEPPRPAAAARVSGEPEPPVVNPSKLN